MTTTKHKFKPYYNLKRLWSYNAVYNFVVGDRGYGKTYGAKKAGIKDNIKNNEEFIYLRRYKTELSAARATLFADIEHEFPDWDFRVFGNKGQKSRVSSRSDKKREWTTVCHFIALSTAQTQKSVSFPKVTKIIFDEFIIETSNITYLKDEADVFNNFYNTVDRYSDRTKVLFLANSVSVMNPYFIKYDIRPDKMREYTRMYDGFILCHFPQSKDFRSSVYESRFGKFIHGTDYADYAVGSKFADGGDNLLDAKPEDAKYRFTLETRRGLFSVWYAFMDNRVFIQAKRPKGNEVIYTLLAEEMTNNKVMLTFNDKLLSYLRTSFRKGNVYFDSPTSRNAFIDVFKR